MNAYAELGIFYVGQNLVIELSDSDEEGQDDSMHEGEDEEDVNEELPMPPLELSNEELSPVAVAPPVIPCAFYWMDSVVRSVVYKTGLLYVFFVYIYYILFFEFSKVIFLYFYNSKLLGHSWVWLFCSRFYGVFRLVF